VPGIVTVRACTFPAGCIQGQWDLEFYGTALQFSSSPVKFGRRQQRGVWEVCDDVGRPYLKIRTKDSGSDLLHRRWSRADPAWTWQGRGRARSLSCD
jgi:hypothetical protein